MSSNKKNKNRALQVATVLASTGFGKNAAGLKDIIQGDNALWDAMKNVPGPKGRTPLMYAADTGDMARVRFLLARGANPNLKTSTGKTALMFASEMGHDDIVRELCSKGHPEDAHPHPMANVNDKDFIGMTALMSACMGCHINTVSVLLNLGADVNLTATEGSNALMFAASVGEPCKAVIRKLLDSGININARDKAGKTALFKRTEECFGRTPPDLMRLLIDLGADVNITTNSGETPLMQACRHNTIEAATLLCDNGANLDAVELGLGTTALMYATIKNSKECLQLLCDRGADKELQTISGSTAINLTVWNGSIDCLRILAEAGANLDVENNSGATPLMNAAAGNLLEMFGAPPSHRDIGTGTGTECLRSLCEYGANVDLRSALGGTTAAILAAETGSAEKLEILKDHGANLNLGDDDNRTPLYVAVAEKNKECVTLLCKLGVQMDIPATIDTGEELANPPQYTPLMLAAEEGDFDLVKILCSYGAHGGWENPDGDSALTLAKTDEIRKYIEHDIKSPAGKLLSYLPLSRFGGGKRRTRRCRRRHQREYSKKRKTRAH